MYFALVSRFRTLTVYLMLPSRKTGDTHDADKNAFRSFNSFCFNCHCERDSLLKLNYTVTPRGVIGVFLVNSPLLYHVMKETPNREKVPRSNSKSTAISNSTFVPRSIFQESSPRVGTQGADILEISSTIFIFLVNRFLLVQTYICKLEGPK